MPDTWTESHQIETIQNLNLIASKLDGLTRATTNKPTDLIQEIQFTGLYQDRKAYCWSILGNRTTFADITSLQDICEFLTTSQNFTPVTPSDTLEIVSTSASDSALGSGARKVRVTYLDANGFLTESPDISLSGILAVPTGFNASAILWMEVVEGGSIEYAAGNISLQRPLASATFERITSGSNKSQSARLTIPKGYTGYLHSWSAEAQPGCDIRLRATTTSLNRILSTRFIPQDKTNISQAGMFTKSLDLLRLPELTRVKASGKPTAANSQIGVDFFVIVISNTPVNVD